MPSAPALRTPCSSVGSVVAVKTTSFVSRRGLGEAADQRVAAALGREVQIDDGDVGLGLEHELGAGLGGPGDAGHLPAELGQHVAEEDAQRPVVLHDRHAANSGLSERHTRYHRQPRARTATADASSGAC